MPIIGTIYAVPHEERVDNMDIGQVSFFESIHLIVTQLDLFLEIDTPIGDKNEFREGADLIKITRIGKGLTEDDFELDLSFLNNNNHIFYLEGAGVYLEKISETGRFVIFKDFDLFIDFDPEVNEDEDEDGEVEN